MIHADLIGRPFAYGGRGPEAYDCYGLVMEMWRRVHGTELPDYGSPEKLALISLHMHRAAGRDWVRVDDFTPGSVVLFRVEGFGAHVGFVLPYRRFLHAWHETGGVTREALDTADWRERRIGCYRFAGPDASI
ncbi:MAG TPA: NlpC/P60 family protein [Kaistia sp.]|jgi:cell wall-associated NlpC family hydrolase|nr:NlpC/P60 family protein [Kaistia sp.]